MSLLLLFLPACTALAEVGAAAPPAAPAQTVIDLAALTRRTPLNLAVGEQVVVIGYAAAAIAVEDDSVLHLVGEEKDVPAGSPPRVVYVALQQGQTELIVTQSMCEGVMGCSGPAFFYHLPIFVR